MKKLFVLMCLAVLVGSNVYISRKSDNSFKITIELPNVALAEDEGSEGGHDCWINIEYYRFARALECGYICCYREDMEQVGPKFAICPGTFGEC